MQSWFVLNQKWYNLLKIPIFEKKIKFFDSVNGEQTKYFYHLRVVENKSMACIFSLYLLAVLPSMLCKRKSEWKIAILSKKFQHKVMFMLMFISILCHFVKIGSKNQVTSGFWHKLHFNFETAMTVIFNGQTEPLVL